MIVKDETSDIQHIEQIRQKTFNPDLKDLIQDIRDGEDKEDEANGSDVENRSENWSLESLLDFYWNNELTLYFTQSYFSCNQEDEHHRKFLSFLAKWQDQIQTIVPQKWTSSDILSHILDQVWDHRKSDSEKIRLFFNAVQYSSRIIGAKQLAILNYSPFANCYRIIYQNGLDHQTKTDFAFVPGEKIVKDLVEKKKPLVYKLADYKNDPFFRKKFSPKIWAEKKDMVLMPILADFGDLKPKNLILAAYIRSHDDDFLPGRWILDRVHFFLSHFYPIIDVLQVSGANLDLLDDIVEMVHNYFLDRRLYAISRENSQEFQFLVIQFQLSCDNIRLLKSSFYYLSVKIRDKLSHLSKIMRHSFNEGYLLLRGKDRALWPEIKEILDNHQDQVDYIVKNYPESGFNLFNYQ